MFSCVWRLGRKLWWDTRLVFKEWVLKKYVSSWDETMSKIIWFGGNSNVADLASLASMEVFVLRRWHHVLVHLLWPMPIKNIRISTVSSFCTQTTSQRMRVWVFHFNTFPCPQCSHETMLNGMRQNVEPITWTQNTIRSKPMREETIAR